MEKEKDDDEEQMEEEESRVCSWINRSKAFKTPNLADWVSPNLAGHR